MANREPKQRPKSARDERLYFDYAASTPVDARVEAAMRPYFTLRFGNPSSLHGFGQEAIAAVDASREKLAKAIGADFREIIFTGSATESNNIALRGLTQTVRRQTQTDKSFSVSQREVGVSQRPRIVVSAVEHESVLETARDLGQEGIDVVYIPVDRRGVIDLKKLEEALNERTVLVSVMYANNEVGIVQPISKVSEIIRNFREQIGNRKSQIASRFALRALPLLHTDAAQALQFLDCNVQRLGADFMTLSAHKIYGPKGVGALYLRGGTRAGHLRSLVSGGGQEFGLRSGTENVPLIVGFGKAVELAQGLSLEETGRIAALRKKLWSGIRKACPNAKLNLALPYGASGKEDILPNILNICFPGRLAEELLLRLDLLGLAASSGSACATRSNVPSYVLRAMGFSAARAKASIRFSLGRPTTGGDIDRAAAIIKNVCRRKSDRA